MTGPAKLLWLVRHEARLGIRDLAGMLRAGRRGRGVVTGVLVVGALLIHLLAYKMVGDRGTALAAGLDAQSLVVVTLGLALAACMLLSQAIESVTRVLYGRGDLELILSSPTSSRLVLAIRIGIVGISVAATTLFIAGPFANVMAFEHGARWLCVYPVILALGLAMTALGLLITMGLVRLLGPGRTRLAAQVVAAIVGAAFAIGLQMAAIVQYGELSRFAVLSSEAMLALAPDPGGLLWLPARAATGEPLATATFLGACMLAFAAVLALCIPGLTRATLVIASLGTAGPARRAEAGPLAWGDGAAAALRRKELRLLLRDPWLVSQTLMQVLYLLPPAFLLWRSFGDTADKLVLLVPVLVMSAGQLSGSLAWLAVSGEDAPDLVATAPVARSSVIIAKFGAVLAALGLVVLPFGLALALLSAPSALAMLGGAFVAALSAFTIQYWFRAQGRRSQFRRRQTASRVATFAEALSSILWAATAAIAAVGSWLAFPVALLALGNLFGARMLSPRPA